MRENSKTVGKGQNEGREKHALKKVDKRGLPVSRDPHPAQEKVWDHQENHRYVEIVAHSIAHKINSVLIVDTYLSAVLLIRPIWQPPRVPHDAVLPVHYCPVSYSAIATALLSLS